MSTALGTKSVYLAEHSILKGYDFVCYDPECVSDLFEKAATDCLEDFIKLEFSHWFDDANTAINYIRRCNEGKNHKILMVGSSMGGWISLSLATKYPELVKGIVLIAPAVNFMRKSYLKWYNDCTLAQQKELDLDKTVIMKSPYGEIPFSKRFCESSREVELDLTKPIKVNVPVRILHGVQDESVPYENSISLMKLLQSEDVDLLYRKAGDHRLCGNVDLQLLSDTLDKMIKNLE